MGVGAFGQPLDGRFDPDDFYELVPLVFRLSSDDKDQITEWCRTRLTNRQAFHQFVLTLAECCAAIMRTVLGHGDDPRFAILHTEDGVSRSALLMGRLVAATYNGDADTQKALIKTLIEYTERTEDGSELALVSAELVGLFHFLLNEASELPRSRGVS